MTYQKQLHTTISNLFDSGFRFRPFQEETILRMADLMIANPKKSVLIDAPTGTGKSILSMVGSMLFNSFGKTGYILTSDLGLQTQYENDIERLKLSIPSVRGMDNYSCSVNGLEVSLSECRTRGVNPQQLRCYSDCLYYYSRDIAAASRTSLLNYSYWLLQLNYLKDKSEFKERDFCFFDEAHKIESIVQSHYSPRIGMKFGDFVRDFVKVYREELDDIPDYSDNCYELINSCVNTPSSSESLKFLRELDELLKKILEKTDSKFKNFCANTWNFGVMVPDSIRKAQWQIDRISDVHCKIEDYLKFLEDEKNMVRVIERGDDSSASFKNLEETGLIRKVLIENSKFRVFMSATLGNPDNFAKFIGIDDFEYISIDNQFDHSRSPIFYIRGFKMNYSKKEENFPKVLSISDSIMNKHSRDRGIIHTASFAIANEIYEKSSNKARLIMYDSSKEKQFAIDEFSHTPESILIGPSLLEGLSFDDDLSRFQIFFKIPFPNLSDEFVKKLLKLYPEKYMSRTVNSVIQGIGRSIRSSEDWAVTYILDECFDQLANSKYLPESYLNRLSIKRVKDGTF